MNEALIRAAVCNGDIAEALERMDASGDLPLEIREKIDEVAIDVCIERLTKLQEPEVPF